MKRGQPDVIKRVETPKGGLPGSKGSLLLKSLHTGIPGYPSYQMRQDDFIADVNYRIGGSISVARSPSAVVRVFLPPVATWEKRSGPQFAFRIAVETTVMKSSKKVLLSPARIPRVKRTGLGCSSSLKARRTAAPTITLTSVCRSDQNGGDFKGKQITTTGWWTMGLSCTPDGMVHYYAKPGIEDLTQKDHITSQYPYGYRAERFNTFFFNVCNGDDGRTWSTDWIVDDCAVYLLR